MTTDVAGQLATSVLIFCGCHRALLQKEDHFMAVEGYGESRGVALHQIQA